ncbi:hypothetical protein P154DRAFT_426969 [Amniculicola lignicola CBS 123094]|uniref:DUF1308 domain-containing protein n=1 Tax=Amniculicola lignicola CBS 123094 TaxID=1392246 RepID=A0A6A5WTM4_9PLEO|nr:hypothetical protein P154DRAFT_426969 [Amniculicola lignicola CBS 123094]
MASAITSSLENLQLSSNQHANNDPKEQPDFKAAVDDVLERCKNLYDEVETYVAAVEANHKLARLPNPVEYRSLRNGLKNEVTFLKKITASSTHSEEKIRHYILSSNLAYFEALWATAKRSSSILAFRKMFFLQGGSRGVHSGDNVRKDRTGALVDIVGGDGMEWVRLSTISEKRLLFDLAKLGWHNDDDSDGDDEEMMDAPTTNWEDDDDDDQVDIVKNARTLARSARANLVRGHPPSIKFILPRIESGKTKEIDAVLNKIRETGATVECGNNLGPPPSLAYVLPNLLVDRSRWLSQTLNIDCTILLALISDISHSHCPILDWYPGEVRAQIKEEEKEKLLPTHLYPAIGDHPMVCTEEAAEQMNVIADTLATDSEKTRANLLLGQRTHSATSPAAMLEEWASLSDHKVPPKFQLPIHVLPSNVVPPFQGLPKIAGKIADELGPLNTSIFLFGWRENLTTLSSNRARAKLIDHLINRLGLEDGETAPHIWLCGESRSLIAKHGRR